MFNNSLFKYSSMSNNYFYDLIRSGVYDKEKFKQDYLSIFKASSLSENATQGLDFLLSYPGILDKIIMFRDILNQYNLNFDDVENFNSYSRSQLKDLLKAYSIKSTKDVSYYEFFQAKNIIQNYEFNSSILKQMGNDDSLTMLGYEYKKKDLIESNLKSYPEFEEAKRIVELYNQQLEEEKKIDTLQGYNHSIYELEKNAETAYKLINEISIIVGKPNVRWVKYFLRKPSKFFMPLFEKTVSNVPETGDEIYTAVDTKSEFDSKEDFIKHYLDNHSLAGSENNERFVQGLSNVWNFQSLDNNFINNLRELKTLINSQFGDDAKLDYGNLLEKVLLTNKKFRSQSVPVKLRNKKYEDWYVSSLKYLSSNKDKYLEAKKYINNIFTLNPEDINNQRDQISQASLFIKEYDQLNKSVLLYKTDYDGWAKDKIIEPYGKSLSVLSEIYEKVKVSLHFFDDNESISKFLNTYLNDSKYKALLGDNDQLNFVERFEIILENYIAADKSKRLDIIKKLNNPQAFAKLLNTKYQDLKSILSREGLVEKNKYLVENDFDLVRSNLIKRLNIWQSELNVTPSKHFEEFNLNNSSLAEKKLFDEFEKIGLHAVPASQNQTLRMSDAEGNMYGFRIDFLLPCNVRVYDKSGKYTLKQDVIFVGEYFGFYGEAYEKKTNKKIELQNMLEQSLDQRCLHIKDTKNLCPVLTGKNIDCKCFPDFDKQLYDINNADEKKKYFVIAEYQNFLYSSLINELLWRINYNYAENTVENFNKIKNLNIEYINRFEDLISSVDRYSPIELRKMCSGIIFDYNRKFGNEKSQARKLIRQSNIYNIRIK